MTGKGHDWGPLVVVVDPKVTGGWVVPEIAVLDGFAVVVGSRLVGTWDVGCGEEMMTAEPSPADSPSLQRRRRWLLGW